ncbi:MAG: ATPase [Amylibacter sp.]
MLYNSASEWTNASKKRVMLFGMSGLGKTYVSNILRASGWFHYSVDYRIGTRYMGEHIVDNFKSEAMKNPFLAELLRDDSIYIGSKITFDNLAPLSTYLGKPGNPAKGGIAFPEYTQRQGLHQQAETNAMLDTVHFIDRAKQLYGYDNFICDTSGSMVEVIEANSPADPVMVELSEHVLPVWIEGSESHVEELVKRFAKAPKPMYYKPDFLGQLWSEYLANNALTEPDVDPDDFILWGYRMLLDHRLPRYRKIAERWGVTVQADDMALVRTHDDFNDLIARTLA